LEIQFKNAITFFKDLILSELKEKMNVSAIVAGGAVRDYFRSSSKSRDIDLFFRSEKDFLTARDFFVNTCKCRISFQNENSIKVVYGSMYIDLIGKMFMEPEDLIKEFDFTISMFAVDENNVYHGQTSFIDLAKQQLMINALPYPESSMRRLLRYYDKGFRICNEELLKLLIAIQNSDKLEVKTKGTLKDKESQESSYSDLFHPID
jgi:hypothetical protein